VQNIASFGDLNRRKLMLQQETLRIQTERTVLQSCVAADFLNVL
jgi:hypothetical protein